MEAAVLICEPEVESKAGTGVGRLEKCVEAVSSLSHRRRPGLWSWPGQAGCSGSRRGGILVGWLPPSIKLPSSWEGKPGLPALLGFPAAAQGPHPLHLGPGA